MPVYQYEGKHYDLPDGLTNEQAIAKIESYLGKTPSKQEAPKEAQAPSPEQDSWLNRLNKAMTPTYTGDVVSGISKGLTDPLQGIVQAVFKGGEALGIPGAGTAAEQMRQREVQYEQARQQAGEGGFDFSRMAGNVLSPVNYAVPSLTAIDNPLARSVATGAIQGAVQPVTNEDFWSSKALQAGIGAVTGPILEGSVKAIGKIADVVKGFGPSGRDTQLRKYFEGLIGPESDDAIKALQDAKELITGSRPTAAEVLSDIPSSAELIAAQRKLQSKEGVARLFEARAAEQQAARARAIENIAGTQAQRDALKAARDAATSTQRESALQAANVAKETLEGINKQANREAANIVKANTDLFPVDEFADQRFADLPVSGYSLKEGIKKRAAALKQTQLDSLANSGVFPIYAKDLTSQLDKAIQGSKSDQTKAVLSMFRDKIASKADENGIVSSVDLYENVRKTANQDIAKLLGLGEQYASGGIPEQAAAALGNMKKFIDSALDKTTNGLWTDYLKNYAAHSTKLNRMEIGDFLSKKLNTSLDKERAGVFATAVENAASTIKRSTGIPRFQNLSQVMTEQEVGTINSVLADLSRKSKADEIAKRVGQLEGATTDVAAAIPPWIDKGITVLKEGLRYLQRGNAEKFNQRMAELYLNPQQLAQLITEGVPKSKINKVVQLMYSNMDEGMKSAFLQAYGTSTAGQMAGQ